MSRIVIADEPTANVDAANAIALLELMSTFNTKKGVTFITASHDERLTKYATRVVRLADGLIVEGTR